MFESPPSGTVCPRLAMKIRTDNSIVDRVSTSKVELALPRLKTAGRNKQLGHYVVIEWLLMSFSGISQDSRSRKRVKFLVRV